jgi:outer membrane lipoprotein carrier protein
MALASLALCFALAAAGPDAGAKPTLAPQSAVTKPVPAKPAAKPAASKPTPGKSAEGGKPPASAKGKAADARPAEAKPAPGAAPPGGGAVPLAEVVGRMQKQYESATDFRARFTQKYTSAATGRERALGGELLIKKPGRMRWNYETPTPQMYLANGQTFWLYEPEEKQAYKQDLKTSQLPAAVSFLMGRGKLGDEFDIAFAKELPGGDPKAYRLALTPKKAQSTYRAIYFIVNPTTFLVDQSILINAEGDVNAITFSDVKINTKLGEDLFKWAPPAGVRVIDANK